MHSRKDREHRHAEALRRGLLHREHRTEAQGPGRGPPVGPEPAGVGEAPEAIVEAQPGQGGEPPGVPGPDGAQEGRGREEAVLDATDGEGDEVLRRLEHGPQRKIRLAPREIHVLVGHVDLDLDPLVLGAQVPQRGRQEEAGQELAGRDPHLAHQPKILPEDLPLRRQRQGLHPLRAGDHRGPAGVRRVPAPVPLEEAHPEGRLRLLEPAVDRRVAHRQVPRGAAQAAGAADREHRPQQVPVQVACAFLQRRRALLGDSGGHRRSLRSLHRGAQRRPRPRRRAP